MMSCEPNRANHQPALIVLIAFSSGIVLDRTLSAMQTRLPHGLWLLIFCTLALLLIRDYWLQRKTTSNLIVIVLCGLAGGSLHHQQWSLRLQNDISTYASTELQIVEVEGFLTRQPRVKYRQSSPFMTGSNTSERTHCTLRCTKLITDSGCKTISGNAWLSVAGQLSTAEIGDHVRVVGLLGLPSSRVNPGGFDFRTYLRQQHCLSFILAKHADALKVVRRPYTGIFLRSISRWRKKTQEQFEANLNPQAAELASALLLGSRSNMQEQTSRMFAQSGTMHLLAISGVHVGILAAFLWYGTSFCFLPVRFRLLTVLLAMLFYCLMTEMRPSVVRASMFISLGFLARCFHRQAFSINTLSVTAILILLCNSSELFNIGAQLSFLATFGVLLALNINTFYENYFEERLIVQRSRWAKTSDWILQWLRTTCLITIVIWILTAPLIAARFHLIAPVGYLMNIILLPLLIPLLWTGYLYVILLWLIPGCAELLRTGLEMQINMLSEFVSKAGALKWGHCYVADIPNWWLLLYYFLLLFFYFHAQRFLSGLPNRFVSAIEQRNNPANKQPPPFPPKALRVTCAALIAWLVFGFALGIMPAQRSGLRCLVLAVGHGSAILLELPNGKMVLYDAGSLNNDFYASRVIQNALWRRGAHQIDSVILSHADIDHFNALPHLFERVPIGSILMTRHFLSHEDASVIALCRSVNHWEIPVRMINRECRIMADPEVQIRVLHPPAYRENDTARYSSTTHHNDNQNSIVLQITYAGRSLLLTGDVEGAALSKLQQQPLSKINVLVSPHHGSMSANNSKLREWTDADYLIASCSRRDQYAKLNRIFNSKLEVFTTASHGAVTACISADGRISVEPYLLNQTPE